ncbi:MAG: proline racemase family protein [Anaerolineae bacterium]|jgi:trans-L-3-hydroxyproline dehydratase
MLRKMRDWAPPEHWLKITTIDAHTGGEPFRVITGGYPDVPGDSILARRRYARQHLDHLRRALMWEPRGHADMYGCIVTPPASPEADIGVLFLHNEGYSTMCGHGIIGITKVALDTGLLPMTAPETTIRIDTPAGLITAHARAQEGQVTSVRFHNVPSFVLALDQVVEVPGLGEIRYDLAFGGAFYAFVQAKDAGVTCTPEDFRPLIEKGIAIKKAVMDSRSIAHPFEPDLSFLYGTIFVGAPQNSGAHSRNVCIFAEGEVDRCPTGTGVSGRLAIHHARGEIEAGEPMVVESIIGSRFTGRIVETTTFGSHPAVIPEVEGTAHITGRHEFLLDPADPMRDGFILR